MFRFAFMDVFKNYQNSYNQYKYSTNKKPILPLLTIYNNEDYEFKKLQKTIFEKVNNERKKWDKDYSKFTYYKYLKVPDDDEFPPEKNLTAFIIFTLFAGAGIYLFRKSFLVKND